MISFIIKFIVKPLTFIISNNLKEKVKFSWHQLFDQIIDQIHQFHTTLTYILSYVSPHLGLENYHVFLLWGVVILVIHISMILTKNIGILVQRKLSFT